MTVLIRDGDVWVEQVYRDDQQAVSLVLPGFAVRLPDLWPEVEDDATRPRNGERRFLMAAQHETNPRGRCMSASACPVAVSGQCLDQQVVGGVPAVFRGDRSSQSGAASSFVVIVE